MHWLIIFSSVIAISALESRVFNGNVIHTPEHGYLVKLAIDCKYKCSGSIISSNWILSSAHCFTNTAATIIVYQKSATGRKSVIATVNPVDVKKYLHYVDHNNSIQNRQNDIALLKTMTPISMNQNTWAIKLSTVSPSIDQVVVIAGYGDNEVEPFLPREGIVRISQCPYDVEDLLCSFDKVRAGDADSGGALTWKGRLVGVTSASCKEAHRMDVENCTSAYANVVPRLNWIISVITHRSEE